MPPVLLSMDTPVQSVFNRYPATVPVFVKYRMACVGCSLSAFTTLEEAIQVHELDAEPFLEELQQAIISPTKNQE